MEARPAPPEVGGGSLTRIPPGLGMLGQGLLGMLGQGSWEASGQSLGDVLGVFFDVLGVSWRPRWVPGRPWRLLGGLLELLRPPGRLRRVFQGRMGRSWKPLGALLEASWSSLGRFRRPLGRQKAAQRRPKRSPNGAQEGSRAGSCGICRNLKIRRTPWLILVFLRSRGIQIGVHPNRHKMGSRGQS